MGKVIIGMTTGILWDLHVPHKHVHTKETCHFLDIYKVTDYSDINKPWVSTEEEDQRSFTVLQNSALCREHLST